MTTPAPPVTPATPRPPDSRVRWHVLASLAGTVLAAAILWSSLTLHNEFMALAVVAVAATVWALIASQSSLGYLVPGILFGISALVQQFVVEIPVFGRYLITTRTGIIVAVAFGLAIALHFARKDGRAAVLRDELAAAVHASHAPESRRSRHILAGLGAALLAGIALAMAAFGGGGAVAFRWDTLAALVLITIAAALGSLSAWAPLAAGLLGAVFTAFHWTDLTSIYLPWIHQEAAAEGARALAVATLLLVTGAVSCRLARRSGQRAERRERATS
ncbi:MAG: hypothetical protein L0G23_01775 [Ruaniaceae bacterium]|nr:hypothetical protein [Ruaniaceae bacterium]